MKQINNMICLVLAICLMNTDLEAGNVVKLMKIGTYVAMTAIGAYAVKKECNNAWGSIETLRLEKEKFHRRHHDKPEMNGNVEGDHSKTDKVLTQCTSFKNILINTIEKDVPFLAGVITAFYGIKGLISTILDKPHHHTHHEEDDDEHGHHHDRVREL